MEHIIPRDLLDQLEKKQHEKDLYDNTLATKEYEAVQKNIEEQFRNEGFKQKLLVDFTAPRMVVKCQNVEILTNKEALKICKNLINARYHCKFWIDGDNWVFNLTVGHLKNYEPEDEDDTDLPALIPIKKKYETLTREQAQILKDKQKIEADLKKLESQKSELSMQNYALSESLNALTESSSVSLVEIQARYQEKIKALESLLSKKDEMLKQKTAEIQAREAVCKQTSELAERVQVQNEKLMLELNNLSGAVAIKDDQIREREKVLLLVKENDRKIKEYEAKEAKQSLETKYKNLSMGRSSTGTLTRKKT
jgi:hypothetical protein